VETLSSNKLAALEIRNDTLIEVSDYRKSCIENLEDKLREFEHQPNPNEKADKERITYLHELLETHKLMLDINLHAYKGKEAECKGACDKIHQLKMENAKLERQLWEATRQPSSSSTPKHTRSNKNY
jgi:hypothetical protein